MPRKLLLGGCLLAAKKEVIEPEHIPQEREQVGACVVSKPLADVASRPKESCTLNADNQHPSDTCKIAGDRDVALPGCGRKPNLLLQPLHKGKGTCLTVSQKRPLSSLVEAGSDIGVEDSPLCQSIVISSLTEETQTVDGTSSLESVRQATIGVDNAPAENVQIRKKRLLLVDTSTTQSSPPDQECNTAFASQQNEVLNSDESCYNVAYTKEGHKKRPRFLDGILLVRNGLGSLYSEDGKKVGSAQSIKIKEKLPPGRRVFASSNIMIEINCEISAEDFASGRAFTFVAPAVKTSTLTSGLQKRKLQSLVPDDLANCGGQAVARGPPPGAFMLLDATQTSFYLDPKLAQHLRGHQEEGIRFMFQHVHAGHGCILADSMGLGKTLQALYLIWACLSCPSERPLCRKVAVVCPASLCNNWEAECKKWLGSLRAKPIVVQGTTSTAIEKVRSFRCTGNIIIISYEQMRQNADILEDVVDLLVCDEGHRLKSAEASTTRRLNKLRCKRRVLLTGTPLQNDLDEFWCCVTFVQPSLLPALPAFQKIYKQPIDRSQDKSASAKEAALGQARSTELARISKAVILRRGPELLASMLPPRTEMLLTAPLSPVQVATYRALVTANTYAKKHATFHLGLLSMLRQLCNMEPEVLRLHCEDIVKASVGSFVVASSLDASNDTYCATTTDHQTKFCQQVLEVMRNAQTNSHGAADASAKLVLLEALLQWSRKNAPEDGIVIVSGFLQSLQRCADICSSLGLRTWMLTGQTPVHSRLDLVNAFNSCTGARVFLLAAKAGGVGLNIIGANRLIMLEPDWNPAVDLQAMGRVWRQGQTKPVFVYRLATHGTVEEKILQRQARKISLASATLATTSENKESLNDMAVLKEVFVLKGYNDCGVPYQCRDEEVLAPLDSTTEADAGLCDADVRAALYSVGLLGRSDTSSEPLPGESEIADIDEEIDKSSQVSPCEGLPPGLQIALGF